MRRGDIFALRLPKGVGHEQKGRRFGVVVQSDAFLPRSVVLVAPTSTSAKPASFRHEIDGTATRVLVEQVGAVDGQHLGDLAGPPRPGRTMGCRCRSAHRPRSQLSAPITPNHEQQRTLRRVLGIAVSSLPHLGARWGRGRTKNDANHWELIDDDEWSQTTVP